MSRLRHRSTKNSRPWENIPLRRQYLEDNPTCELKRFLYTHVGPEIDKWDESADPHHIVGGAGRRVDAVSNLITVCRSVHDWLHRNPIDGRVVCLWFKLQKHELNAAEFRTISGKYLAGWVELNRPKLEFVVPLWDTLAEVVMGQD